MASDSLLSPELPLAPLLVGVAITIGIAAQSFINQQLNGDQGLGAFLRDGKGYSKSGFRPLAASDKDRAVSGDDPIPWLKLPKLDFVEVAGQEEAPVELDDVVEKLETLRLELNQQMAQGNQAEAITIQNKMQRIMEENGIDFQPDGGK